MRVFLRSQSELKTLLRSILNDAGSLRWTDGDIYQAINQALGQWAGRVSAPMVHTISSGFSAGVMEYALPGYVRPPLRPQFLAIWPEREVDTATEYQWQDVVNWEVEPDASDGLVLRLRTPAKTTQARVIWFAENGTMPTAIPVLTSAGLAVDGTSCWLTTSPTVGDAGYVLIGTEWIGYSGVSIGSAQTQLQNLVRGVNETTAQVAGGAATVTWGVAAPSAGVFNQLLDQAAVYLHERYVAIAAPNERDVHERAISYFTQRAEGFWRRWVPARSPRFKGWYVR